VCTDQPQYVWLNRNDSGRLMNLSPMRRLRRQELVQGIRGSTRLQLQDHPRRQISQHQPVRELVTIKAARPIAIEHQHPDPDRAEKQREHEHRQHPAATAPGANTGQRVTRGLGRSGSSTGSMLAHASTHGPSPNSN
jgi:hypothetical protein